jgi:hypothetical protein
VKVSASGGLPKDRMVGESTGHVYRLLFDWQCSRFGAIDSPVYIRLLFSMLTPILLPQARGWVVQSAGFSLV